MHEVAGDASATAESISNLQLVYEVVHNPHFNLGVAEAEAAWARARLPEEEQQKLVGWFVGVKASSTANI